MMYKRKRIYYPAGLISLVLLPLFCLWNLNREKAFAKQGAMDVALFNKDDTSQLMRSYIKTLPTLRKYVDISFSGNEKNDSLKLAFATMTLHELAESKDTIHGVRIAFNAKTKYRNFAKVVELSYISGITASINRDEAWLYVVPPRKQEEVQSSFFCRIIIVEPNTMVNREIILALENYKNLFTFPMVWATGVYLLMCACAIFKLRSL